MSRSLWNGRRRLVAVAGAVAVMGGFVVAGPAVAAPSVLRVVDPAVNSLADAQLVDGVPVFSWKSESDARAAVQSAYQVRVMDPSGSVVWDSGKTESSKSIDVRYEGPELAASTSYSWSVTVWDGQGNASDPVESQFRTGLRSTDGVTNWAGAQWITQTYDEPTRNEDRFDTMNFQLSADFKINEGGASLNFAGYDDDYLAAAVRQIDGVWHFQLLEGDGNGNLSVFARERSAPSGETWTQEQLFEPVDIVLENFDPTQPHTVTITQDGPIDNVFPSGSAWTIQLDGNNLTAFNLAGNRKLIRAGLLGLGLQGLSAQYANLNLTMPKATEPEKLNENVETLTADPASSIFAGLDGAEIKDGWINVDGTSVQETDPRPSDGLYRKAFSAHGDIKSAHLYASALGVYEFELNGQKVGDSYLAPGTSDFYKTALYNVYDVSDLITNGVNALGAEVGDGWYSGSYGALHKPYGSQPSLKALLRLEYADGSVANIPTDSSWSYYGNGPITDSNLMDGENYDANLEPAIQGWSTASFDDSSWEQAQISADTIGRVVGDEATAIKLIEEISPVERTVDANGNVVFDFGKNLVGVPQITVTGQPGQIVKLSHGEMLNDASAGADGPEGTIYNANFRSAKVTDYYTIGQSGTGTFQPKFTLHGFRYLEVSGVGGFQPQTVQSADVKAMLLSSADKLTMSFESSEDGFNKLYQNTINGLRGNFLSIPTDTPARDERMGWLGDIQVFAPTASMTADVRAFLGKFTTIDMADSQLEGGHYPRFAPWHSGWGFGNGASDPWTDAAIIVPHALWQTYGDVAIIEDNYAQMKAYAQALHDDKRGAVLGDWLAFAKTDTQFVFQVYKVHAIELMEQMARAAGHVDDADTYIAWRDQWKAEFLSTYFPDGSTTLVGEDLNTQAAYSMVLQFGLYPDGQAETLAAHLAELSLAGENGEPTLTTGFLGTPVILPALSDNGQVEAAYNLILSHTYPSWLYSVDQGATTFWERWNSYTKADGFGDVSMNSFNHYAYGAVSKWIYNNVAGINLDPASPGYQHSVLRPLVDPKGRISWVNATFASPYGDIVSNWKLGDNGKLSYKVEVPANASATVYVPTVGEGETVFEGETAVSSGVEGVELVGIENGVAEIKVGSGSYSFSVGVAPVDDPVVSPGLVVDPSRVAQGGSVELKGSGFDAGSVVTLTVHSDPVVAGTPTVSSDGTFALVWTVPADFAVGEHTVIATDAEGVELARATIEVVAQGGADKPKTDTNQSAEVKDQSGVGKDSKSKGKAGKGSLARTGTDTALLLGVAAVLAAGGVVALGRKRKMIK